MTSNKNKKGGKGYRKGKKSVGEKKLIFIEKDQYYAKVVKHLGDQRLICVLHDEFTNDKKKTVEHMAHIRGKMKRKVWINIGDIIIVSSREFGDKTFDVIHKYEYEEVKQLYKLNQLTNTTFITEGRYSETNQEKIDINYSNTFDFESDGEEINEHKPKEKKVKFENYLSESDDRDESDDEYASEISNNFEEDTGYHSTDGTINVVDLHLTQNVGGIGRDMVDREAAVREVDNRSDPVPRRKKKGNSASTKKEFNIDNI